MNAFGAVCASIASSKGRHTTGWFFVGFFFDCIGIIIIACLSNLKEEQAKYRRMRDEQRRLREQLKQERMKSETFQHHVRTRLDRHDEELGVDTRQLGSAEEERLRLEAGADQSGQEAPDSAGDGAAGPADAPANQEWFVKFGTRVSRPLSFARLKQLYQLGNIDDDTLARSGEWDEWRALRDIPAVWDELHRDENV